MGTANVSTLGQAIDAWASSIAGLPDEDSDERIRGFVALIRSIAYKGVMPVDRFANLMKFDIETAKEHFAELSAGGFQTDESGGIIGAYVTTSETPFKLRIIGKDLYAWCALHSLFIPGIIATSANIESICPISGDVIRISVSGRQVTSSEPSEIWLSIFLPSESSRQTGPASPACSQMHFFRDRTLAEDWVKGRDAVVALSLNDAFELAQVHWLDWARRARA